MSKVIRTMPRGDVISQNSKSNLFTAPPPLDSDAKSGRSKVGSSRPDNVEVDNEDSKSIFDKTKKISD